MLRCREPEKNIKDGIAFSFQLFPKDKEQLQILLHEKVLMKIQQILDWLTMMLSIPVKKENQTERTLDPSLQHLCQTISEKGVLKT